MSEQNGSTIDDTMKSGSKKTGAEKAQSAVNKFNKAKKNISRIRSIKSLAWLTSLIGTIGSVLLVIFLLIGAIGFLVTLPGLAMEKFTEACRGFLDKLFGNQEIHISDSQIIDLAKYVQDLGYDLEGYGFVGYGATTYKKDEQGNQTKEIEKINVTDYRSNLYSYVLSNERTYVPQNTEAGFISWVFGSVPLVSDMINSIDTGIRNLYNVNPEKFGMLVFDKNTWNWRRSFSN